MEQDQTAMNFFHRIHRYFDGIRLTNARQCKAEMIRQARRERDLCRKNGWHEQAGFCQFRAAVLMMSTYHRKP